MENSESTLIYKSNIYPISNHNLKDDRDFLSQIHDPFILEIMKKAGYDLTSIQEKEYRYASVHCAYAYQDDYPWGTIISDDGSKAVVCKCTNINCHLFKKCRPDFDISELDVYNITTSSAIFSDENSIQDEPIVNNEDAAAAGKVFAGEERSVNSADNIQELNFSPELPSTEDADNFVIQPLMTGADETDQVLKNVDFTSFIESTQEQIIENAPSARMIINAGPGTGKTWTLIEKIIYMVNKGNVSAEDILVFCFSRSAVGVIKDRLSAAAEEGRIGYEWHDIDIRTFDSFSTYMLAWIQKELPELLPASFSLERCNYDQRICQAASILSQRKDMLTDYQHVFVDEVQDLVGNRAQLVLALLKGLPETCGFTLLGDSCQSLYDYFLTDDPDAVCSEKFYQDIFDSFPMADYYALTENHRQGDKLGAVTIPYRMSILTGTAKERCSEASVLFKAVPLSGIHLQTFSREDAAAYTAKGTLGILTRTNGQALQISAWLRTEGIPHDLFRGSGTSALGDWISGIFTEWENETIDEPLFIQKHITLFPELEYEKARSRWAALVSTQHGALRRRLEIKDLLSGLLHNARDSELYESNNLKKSAITVSNVHRAKGREFDSVIVIDDVISAVTDTTYDDVLEHKVCYVALTRPKKIIERVSLPVQYIYITPNETRRCAKASRHRPGRKSYISHFEVGGDYDIDQTSFAENVQRQEFIRNELQPGTRLKLKKCPGEKDGYVTYSIVLEDRECTVLGYTGKAFASELDSSMQRILKISSHVNYEVFPHAFCDVYVGDKISCISSVQTPQGARTYGGISVWTGFTITGFAAVDKDTY